MSNVQQFIDLIGQGENVQAQEALNDILSAKAFEALEQIKQDIAENLFTESDAYDNDRYAVKDGKAVKDNPSHPGHPNYKDQPHHVWAPSAEAALKMKK